MPCIFWCSVVRCIHIKNYYVFLENQLSFHYIILSCIPDNFRINLLCLKLYSYSCSLLISVSMAYTFSISLIFNLYLSLYLKWIYCTQHLVKSCFFIHSDNLCLLNCVFQPLTCKVIIEIVRIFIISVTFSICCPCSSFLFFPSTFWLFLWCYWAFFKIPLSMLS